MYGKWKPILCAVIIINFGYCDDAENLLDNEEYCYADDPNPYFYFGSKTAYELIRDPKYQPIPNCTPIKIWVLHRHGTRYPDDDEFEPLNYSVSTIRDQIVRNHEIYGRGNLCDKDVKNFKLWNFNESNNLSMQLTYHGKEEMRLHGLRLKQQFPEIFALSYSLDTYQFKSTAKDRARDSAVFFTEGMFGSRKNVQVLNRYNPLLMSSKDCRAWVENKKNPETLKESELFKRSSVFQNMIKRINRRLGFQSNDLKYDDVSLMYASCRYGVAWNIHSKSPFCSVFRLEDFKVLEYLSDLTTYYKLGPGNEISKKIACPLVRDLIRQFSKMIEHRMDEPKASLYFAHSDIILRFLAALELNIFDHRLTHDLYKKMTNRNWRMSVVDPFASNFVAVLYKCTSGEKYRVAFYMNEQIIQPNLNYCVNGICSWNGIKEKYSSRIDQRTCNVDFCNQPLKSFATRLFENCSYSCSFISTIAFSFYNILLNCLSIFL